MRTNNLIRIGVTGHRDISPGTSLSLEPVIKKAIENIILYHKNNFDIAAPLIVSSSIAEGADTIFANVAIKYFDCVLRIILPFEKEEYIKDFTSEQNKKEFEYLLEHNKTTEVICLNNINEGARNILYLEAGKKIINDNDYIIAVWNEEKAKGIGGTGNIIDYARSLQKDVLVINPCEENLKIKGDYLPEILDDDFKKSTIDNLNFNLVENSFIFYDLKALANQKKYKRIWRRCFNLGLLTALIFSIEIAFFQSDSNIKEIKEALILNCTALFVILFISYLVYNEKKKSLHKNYLINRYIAERLRIENIFFKCGYQQDKLSNPVIYSPEIEFNSLLPLKATEKLLQLCCYSNSSFEENKTSVTRLLKEQISYHVQRIEKLSETIGINKAIVNKLFFVFLGLLIAHIVNQICRTTHDSKYLADISKCILFLSLILPAVIARFEAKKYLSEWEKLISHSKYMVDLLNKLLGKIAAAHEHEELCRIINMLNENMYLENLEWEMFMLTKNEILQ